ncbi:MAG: hydroxyneurosporene synthase [Planctomycetota bacterium]|nr:hydroxyneurosporene synthase [Planctomycetota bacterium]
MPDPDRFFNFSTPGAQEWWYFDAISDDGRDVLVLVWYAALPFDPDYGVGTLKHLKNPGRCPAPKALDHCAVGVSWYRDGKTMAYALNGFRAPDFAHSAEPFSVSIAGNRLSRDDDGYELQIDTPAVDGKRRMVARIRFVPASGTEPVERDLGTPDSPHVWILAAADCRVEGEVTVGGRSLAFRGRGYHDHNAGAEEISVAIRRWEWGRFHDGPFTRVYYLSEPKSGPAQALIVVCRDGRPESVHVPSIIDGLGTTRNVFGVKSSRIRTVGEIEEFWSWMPTRCVDDGPFYRRWLTEGTVVTTEDSGERDIRGLGELLDTRNLNRPIFNWMIPFRLKRPGSGGKSVS